MYEETMLSAMPGLVEINAVDKVNKIIDDYLTDNMLNKNHSDSYVSSAKFEFR